MADSADKEKAEKLAAAKKRVSSPITFLSLLTGSAALQLSWTSSLRLGLKH